MTRSQSESDKPATQSASTSAPAKLWGGRFEGNTDAFVESCTASVTFDQRMYRQDIEGSKAHASMLMEVGVLTKEDHALMRAGLGALSPTRALRAHETLL